MKYMTKWITVLLALLLLLCMTACGKKETAAPQETQANAAPSEESQDASAEPETVPPADATEPTAAPVEQEKPAEQEGTTEQESYDDEPEWEIPEDGFDDMGTPPIITVTWETYESMSETEKAAYAACFSNQNAFDQWADMAMTESEMDDMIFLDGGLNLKEILSVLIGRELE